jgi:hypothetical protein
MQMYAKLYKNNFLKNQYLFIHLYLVLKLVMDYNNLNSYTINNQMYIELL